MKVHCLPKGLRTISVPLLDPAASCCCQTHAVNTRFGQTTGLFSSPHFLIESRSRAPASCDASESLVN
ncbi:hypothetical protein OYC64_017703 [Pagothenia borchgrevinki]|uniref:Uncharacterized protein n=1 Tax=Pagothenia borchgrevinki TaxID=8213 RepID=A0ABD2GMB8_PAGBO